MIPAADRSDGAQSGAEPGSDTPTADEAAGAVEPFLDAALYDFEYRRRRADVNFYRALVADRVGYRAGPVLDLACGTGRVTLPLVRDGHTVVGLDRSRPMLAAARARANRLSATRRSRVNLLQGDLRAWPVAPGFAFALAAFHSVQHLMTAADVLAFLNAARAALSSDGWLAFDVLAPDPRWLLRDSRRRWARTRFRHPTTGERLIYTTNHSYDAARKALHIRLFYQPLDASGRSAGPERVVRLCHRQWHPDELEPLLDQAGFRVLARYGGFDGRESAYPHAESDDADSDDEHIYVARPR